MSCLLHTCTQQCCTHRYPASTTIFKFLEILSFSQYNNRFSLVVVTVHRQFTSLQRYSTGYTCMCIFFKNYKVVIKIYLYDGVVVRVVPDILTSGFLFMYLPSLTPPPFNPSTPVIRIFSHVFMTQTASQNSRLPTLLALPAKPQINVNAHTFFMPRVTGRAVGLPRVQLRSFHVPHDFLFLLFV